MSLLLLLSDNAKQETEIVRHFCWRCEVKEVRFVRINIDRLGIITQTFNFIWMCQNSDCLLFMEMKNIKTWRRL
jgi:hypothetical protein